MKIPKFVVLALLLGAFAGSSAYALPIVTVTWATNHSASGGEFILTTTDLGVFNSFCIEENEYVSINGKYFYDTSDKAQLGGLNTVGGPYGDPISIGTAWLYSQFRAGTLSGYSSSSPDDQTSLQNAFWMLENEISALDPTNPWLILANAAIAGDLAALRGDANGAYGVFAVNLWTNADGTGPAQSMLGLTVPDGGLTLTLLGLGLGGLALLRRKLS